MLQPRQTSILFLPTANLLVSQNKPIAKKQYYFYYGWLLMQQKCSSTLIYSQTSLHHSVLKGQLSLQPRRPHKMLERSESFED
jgi:hypothetical protein